MVKFGRKFFFDTKHSKKRRIITYIVIGLLVILAIVIIALILRNINSKKSKKPSKSKTEIVLRSELSTELYAPLPDKTAYFEKLENFDVNNIVISYPSYLPLEPTYDNCNEEELKVLDEIKNGKDASEFDNPEACVTYVPTGIGSYDVTVNYDGKDYTVTLVVDDNTAPTLVVKNLEITEGDKYTPSSFVESCVDNSKKDCTYDYYYQEYNPDINFENYTEPGTYTITLIAYDPSGNKTVPQDATLIIAEKKIQVFTVTFNSDGGTAIKEQYINEGEKASAPASPTKNGYTFAGWYSGNSKFDFNTAITSDLTLTAKWNKNSTPNPNPKPNPSTCSNGDTSYDTNKYPVVALFVSNGKCAISKSDLTSITYGSKATVMAETEQQKLRKWQDANGYDYYWAIVNDKPQGVPNTSGKGYIGYTIQFSIAKQENGNYIEMARYFLDKDGKRHFSLNNTNLPES